jgi:hypothetical protein
VTECLNSPPRNLGERTRSDEGCRLRWLPGPGFTRRSRISPEARKPDHVPHPGPRPEVRKFPSRHVPDPVPSQRPLSLLGTDPIDHTKPCGANGQPVPPASLINRAHCKRGSPLLALVTSGIRPDPAHEKVNEAQQHPLEAITSSPPHLPGVSHALQRRAALTPACDVVQRNEGWLAEA